jgi:acetyl-CoA C-acetyltransferase
MGCSKFGERWDVGIPDLIIEAAYEAFEDAKVGPQDIEMCFFANTNAPNNCSGTPVADTLKMHGIPIVRNENFCASGHIALIEACMAVACGICNVAMAIGAEKLKDTGFGGLGTGRGLSTVRESRRTAPGSFALGAARYFAKYALSYEEGKKTLAKIAVKNHANGMLAPRAHFHKEITVEDCMKAPIIATPLGIFDCCGNSDGAACAIITRAEMAKSFRDDPVYVKGFGIATDAILPHTRPHFDWTSFEALRVSSAKAYDMAGIKNPREEIDLAEVHDCFTVTELLIYEDFGFCPRGKAKENIDAGFFERTGGLPVNVDGGLKCFGHPVGASGIRMTYEIYKQLQYKVDNPKRQIKDAHVGLSHTFGGPPQISAVFIVGNEKG